jgi:hypothetical protein
LINSHRSGSNSTAAAGPDTRGANHSYRQFNPLGGTQVEQPRTDEHRAQLPWDPGQPDGLVRRLLLDGVIRNGAAAVRGRAATSGSVTEYRGAAPV